MAAVSIRDLTVAYTSGGYVVRPINGLDVDAGDGELVLLLGSSGCGKTTLLSALAGILHPAAGTIKVDGTEVTALSGSDYAPAPAFSPNVQSRAVIADPVGTEVNQAWLSYQTGKTTLARHFAATRAEARVHAFDLENPADVAPARARPSLPGHLSDDRGLDLGQPVTQLVALRREPEQLGELPSAP